MTGSSSHGHSPNRASQMRVKTRVAEIPPEALIQSAARVMWAASGASPASRSAT